MYTMRCRVAIKFAYRKRKMVHLIMSMTAWCMRCVCASGVCVCVCVRTSDYHKKSISVQIFNLTWHDTSRLSRTMCVCTMMPRHHASDSTVCENFKRPPRCMYFMGAPSTIENDVAIALMREKNKTQWNRADGISSFGWCVCASNVCVGYCHSGEPIGLREMGCQNNGNLNTCTTHR